MSNNIFDKNSENDYEDSKNDNNELNTNKEDNTNLENNIINGENYFKISEKLRMTYKRKTTYLLNDSENVLPYTDDCWEWIRDFHKNANNIRYSNALPPIV